MVCLRANDNQSQVITSAELAAAVFPSTAAALFLKAMNDECTAGSQQYNYTMNRPRAT